MPGRVAQNLLGALAPAARDWHQQFSEERFAQRLRQADPTLWTDDAQTAARVVLCLGWVDAPAPTSSTIEAAAGQVLLLGMGGSSLGAQACARAFGTDRLRVVDSTVPDAVGEAEAQLERVTDVVVASKSGGTLETAALADYFEDRCAASVRFHAVTDPNSELARRAAERAYASCSLNASDIGGRFSVLSEFGRVPLSLAGIDFDSVHARGLAMAGRCAQDGEANPGVWLGAVLAAAAAAGRNKLMLVAAPELDGLGDWIEQLVAESTGKDGKGIVPVTRARPGTIAAAPADRVVVTLEWEHESLPSRDVDEWIAAGIPVVRTRLAVPADMGGEFYRWQVAVAAVGRALQINPFDEPNVASAKQRTAEVLAASEASESAGEPAPAWTGRHLALYGAESVTAGPELLRELVAGDDDGYIGILAFLAQAPATEAMVERLRAALPQATPVTVGWGPRYLHSSGQLHKGGPNAGRFLVLTATSQNDRAIPGRPWTFGDLAGAQAVGDAAALQDAGRHVVRAQLIGDLDAAVAELITLLQKNP